MDIFLAWLAGCVTGTLVAWNLWVRGRATPAAPEVLPAPSPVVVEVADEPLSAKLYRLSQPLEAFGDNSAHPSEIADRAEFNDAVALLCGEDVSLDTVTQYALGANWTMACAALAALRQRSDGDEASFQVVGHFGRMRPWPMHFALLYLSGLSLRVSAGAPVVSAETWWKDNIVIPTMFRSYFTRLEQSGERPEFGNWTSAHHASEPAVIEGFLKSLNHSFATAMIADLGRATAAKVDTSFLESVGRLWTKAGTHDPLIEPDEWRELLAAAENALAQKPARSIIVHGEPKVGKSAFLQILGNRLIKKGWTIFEAGGPELQAGQNYIGQLEERVRRLVIEAAADKRIVWYVPDILQIAVSGTHSGQTASILDQVLPAINAGRLVILSEATPTQVTHLVQLRPNLKGVFEVAPLAALSEERTLELVKTYVQRLASRTTARFAPEAAPLALQLARQYLSTSQLPGVVFDLMKLAYNRCVAQGSKTVSPRDVLTALSQTTGLPVAILDASEKVELGVVRKFFGERVIGQNEAVQAIVDRIAMLKAGLTDPAKPIGVFLLAGPTGTGKTELAKTLADYLFGSSERMIRLDMSEFKNQDSLGKIIGEAGSGGVHTDSLINRVRKQPFSVVLLDEFEKAHSNVWDLFLQVFDDGRLSDAQGNAADFRHCIIILTSNLGATAHQSSGLGFGARPDAFSSEQILHSIAQAFRPEFVNRLDKVIVFQPLKRELMREILQKELRMVLERRGLRNREWAVEWESSALEFLLDKGFSAQLGARPLKRAIDQYLLAPLAATIVEHRIPQGDQFLFVRSDGRGIQVEFVDPDGEPSGARPGPGAGTLEHLPLAKIILDPQGTAQERNAIEAEHRELAANIEGAEWQTLSAKLSVEIADPAIWSRADRYDVLSRYALMDRVKAAARTADALRERLDKGRNGSSHFSHDLMGRLARQIYLAKAGSIDALANAPVESVVSVEVALDGGGETAAAIAWSRQVLGMYKAWASKRGMQAREFSVGGPALLAVSGFGAHRLLSEEAGLHVLEADDSEVPRLTARVRVAPAPAGELRQDTAGRELKRALDAVPVSSAVVRRYRSGASPLVRDAKRGWRSGKFEAVMGGDFDLLGAVAGGG
ncbi:MAG: AAA family ATPase [Alphaproteobacteria bacterium]|nr:AAA family ATPase [Alphaproteobacteria bacterium]